MTAQFSMLNQSVPIVDSGFVVQYRLRIPVC